MRKEQLTLEITKQSSGNIENYIFKTDKEKVFE